MTCLSHAPGSGGGLPSDVKFDVNFDFRSDTPGYGKPGVDPDKSSPELRRCHQLLWSKRLPGGALFELEMIGQPDQPGWRYLHHRSELGEFQLNSDAVVPFWSHWKRMSHIIDLVPPAEIESFNRLGYTIGGMMVWPANRVDGKGTINQDRGCNSRIDDRFDLTVECIRRHYLGERSPLSDTLGRYPEFFALFGGFEGYVDFFYLQDLVDEPTSTVRFFTPFDDFIGPPRPATLEAYLLYRDHAAEFLKSRNRRIAASIATPAH